jgi:benzoate membrane transport protein
MSHHAAGQLSGQAVSAGLVAAIVGFASSFAVVLKGLSAAGASQAQAASGLMALAIAMGLAGIALSLWKRMPIGVAWSTPGAALLAATGAVEGGFPAAVGAFVITAVLLVLSGALRPLGRAIGAIPAPLANAMLAGVLFGLCLAPVRALVALPVQAGIVIVTWLLVGLFRKLWATPAALLVTIIVIALDPASKPVAISQILSQPVLTLPVFTWQAVLGIAVPLFIVTMASQNIPGMAVLNANGYRPDAGPLIQITGWFSLAATPFGGHAVNLSAITAALCAGPDADPNPARRYWATIACGAAYVLFGIVAGAAAAIAGAAPPVLIEAVAGLALLGSLAAALHAALDKPEGREAAIVTFIVTTSGFALFGIGAAFWGLIAGGLVHAATTVAAIYRARA